MYGRPFICGRPFWILGAWRLERKEVDLVRQCLAFVGILQLRLCKSFKESAEVEAVRNVQGRQCQEFVVGQVVSSYLYFIKI